MTTANMGVSPLLVMTSAASCITGLQDKKYLRGPIFNPQKYMWQSRVEIEDYSALAKNELVMLIEALGRPQLFAEVLALIVA